MFFLCQYFMEHHVQAGGVVETGGGGNFWGAMGASDEEVGSYDALRRWWCGGALLECHY